MKTEVISEAEGVTRKPESLIAGSALLRRLGRLTAIVGSIAFVAAAILVVGHLPALAGAWRCAVFSCVGIALGSMIWILIHEITGGAWLRGLKPFLLAGTRLLPWTLLLLIPMLLTMQPATGLVVRTLGCGAVLTLLSVRAVRAGRRAGVEGGETWVGPAGLIAVLFLSHLLVGDWISALDPGWNSTAFPVVWLIGQAVSAFGAAMVMALLGGADPRAPESEGRAIGLDWGTLLFAGAMLWCYVAFAEFLIVWSGNLPPETSWYLRRAHGAWAVVPWGLLLLHFLLPLIVLLSRQAKVKRGLLLGAAAALVVAQVVYLVWLIVPAYPDTAMTLSLTLLLIVGLRGLCLNRYLTWARREGGAP